MKPYLYSLLQNISGLWVHQQKISSQTQISSFSLDHRNWNCCIIWDEMLAIPQTNNYLSDDTSCRCHQFGEIKSCIYLFLPAVYYVDPWSVTIIVQNTVPTIANIELGVQPELCFSSWPFWRDNISVKCDISRQCVGRGGGVISIQGKDFK